MAGYLAACIAIAKLNTPHANVLPNKLYLGLSFCALHGFVKNCLVHVLLKYVLQVHYEM
jgi:hypothetical protein